MPLVSPYPVPTVPIELQLSLWRGSTKQPPLSSLSTISCFHKDSFWNSISVHWPSFIHALHKIHMHFTLASFYIQFEIFCLSMPFSNIRWAYIFRKLTKSRPASRSFQKYSLNHHQNRWITIHYYLLSSIIRDSHQQYLAMFFDWLTLSSHCDAECHCMWEVKEGKGLWVQLLCSLSAITQFNWSSSSSILDIWEYNVIHWLLHAWGHQNKSLNI